MSDQHASTPTAPSFRAMLNNQSVTVGYDPAAHAVVVVDDRDRVLAQAKVMPNHPPLEVSDGGFVWHARRLEPAEDDYGLAVAFAHFVNNRGERSAEHRLFGDPIAGETRWQYAVVNIGILNAVTRMSDVLSAAGSGGWELVSVYDKASNWWVGMEKGFMLFKRPVPSGFEPHSWCLSYSKV